MNSPDKGKGKGKKGSWKGAWGKGGKGAYSVEDDWSVGYSSYSFDTPLFLNTQAQEAASEWQVVKSKKTKNPSRKVTFAACAHNTCACLGPLRDPL